MRPAGPGGTLAGSVDSALLQCTVEKGEGGAERSQILMGSTLFDPETTLDAMAENTIFVRL